MRLLSTVVSLAVAAQLSACRPVVDCPDVLVTAVAVSVVNPRGEEVKDARVSFSRNGSSMEEAQCFDDPMIDGCESWSIFGNAGDYLVRATSADGGRVTERQVEVEQDDNECFPISVELTLTLPD
jgi:hypothetical protein